jgi:dihydroorotase
VIGFARAFALLAGNPARLLKVDAGELRAGAEADLALINPHRPWIVDSAKMQAAAGNTPFDRRPAEGRVLALFKGGAAVL